MSGKYTNNSLTAVTLVDRLNVFKERVDNLGSAFLNLDLDVDYKKVGGLHHWRIGRLGGSVYIKKAKVSPKRIAPKADDVVLVAEPNPEVKNWQERIKIGTGKSNIGWTPIEE